MCGSPERATAVGAASKSKDRKIRCTVWLFYHTTGSRRLERVRIGLQAMADHIQANGSFVHAGGFFVHARASLVHAGPSLFHPGGSLFHSGPFLLHPRT